MSAPFQPGDVVVCVDARSPDGSEPALQLCRGHAYRVSACGMGLAIDRRTPQAWVDLVGQPVDAYRAWAADRFRKIDDEVCEDFREQIRSLGKGEPARHTRERVA